jgi:hypothetical protein
MRRIRLRRCLLPVRPGPVGGRVGLGSAAVPDDDDVAVEEVVAEGAMVRLTESQAQADLLAVL